jgi:hypothetical protein
MRFIHLFLIGYFVLIIGIGLALWKVGFLIAVGLGIMMSVASGKPTITEEFQK